MGIVLKDEDEEKLTEGCRVVLKIQVDYKLLGAPDSQKKYKCSVDVVVEYFKKSVSKQDTLLLNVTAS